MNIERVAASGVVLKAIAFADGRHGWAAGQGLILGTSDGGAHWVPQYRSPADVTSLDSLDAMHVWGVSSAGLLRTTDGGTQWTLLTEPAAGRLTQVDFISPTTGFGLTSTGLLRTSDGGRSWTVLPAVDPPSATSSATATQPASGSAAPATARSPNGGRAASGPLPVTAVCFSTASDGWAGANPASGPGGMPAGEVLRTTDGGRTWTVSFDPYQGTIESVEQLGCSGPAAWVELGGGGGMMQHSYSLFRTEDSGATWSPMLTISTAGGGPGPGPTKGAAEGPGSWPGPLAVTGAAEAYFFGVVNPGNCGPLLPVGTTDAGATWTTGSVVSGGYTCSILGGYPAAAFVAGGRGWLVAGRGSSHSAIFATADGGRTWREQYPSTALQPLVDVSFLGPTDGFGLGTAGDGSAILRTGDGGRTWIRVGELPDDGGAAQAHWISFADAEHGWALSGNRPLLATSDGGSHWAPVPMPAAARRVFGGGTLLAPQVGCIQASLSGAAPICTADGGATWQPAARGKESTWTAAATLLHLPLAAVLSGRYPPTNTPVIGGAVGPQAAWISDYTELYTTTDAGASWTRFTWPRGSGGPGTAISFATPADGWLVNQGLFATTDGGAVWKQIGKP